MPLSWYQKNYPIIGEHVGVNFMAKLFTIAAVWLAKTPLILA